MNQTLIGVVGSKNSGKSTFISKCSKFLRDEGYKIAIIKFSHSQFTLDPKNKDSLLFRDSQAEKFVFVSPFEQVTYQKLQERKKPKEILSEIEVEVDIVFCESYPNSSKQIPLIFTAKDVNDYLETKTRYKDQKPLFVTGKPNPRPARFLDREKALLESLQGSSSRRLTLEDSILPENEFSATFRGLDTQPRAKQDKPFTTTQAKARIM